MAAKKQLPAAAAEETNKSMAALMRLLRATMSEEKQAGGAAAIGAGGTGEEKVEWLRSQLIGSDVEFDTPFGRRALTYADQTASGRSLRYIEDYLVKEVLPFYGNTHTEDSHVGSKTTRLVHKASRYVKRCMGAAGPGDAMLFCGAGTTAAIKRLQEVMGIAVPSVELRARVAAQLRAEERWVVFVGPYEHHSNLLSWRRSLAEVVEIGVDEDGLVDVAALRRALASPEFADRPMLGSFSACSNVTGIVTDTRRIARVLHEHGAFACFDFAAR
jgi:selenocysteine lyase/cysteine desulfurase